MPRRPRRRASLRATLSESLLSSRPVATGLLVVLACIAIALTTGLSSATPQASDHSGSPFADPQLRAQAQAAAQAAERRASERKTPAARAARRASRERFRGASDADALEIARAQLPQLLGRPAYRPLRGSGGDVDRYLGGDAQSALLDTGHGERVLVESSLPLRGEDADGHPAPVDLALADRGDSFEPASAPVRASLPSHLSDGVALPYDGGTLRVRALGMDGGAPRQSGDDLFYANAADDTDLVATALPTGAELSDVVRSPAGPETFAYALSGLPDGAEVKRAGAGAVVVKGEERIATVAPPIAYGADGVPVPVELSVAGDRLELAVAHRDRDVAYPLVVDPVVETFTWQQATNNDFTGWAYSYAPASGNPAHASGLTSAHAGVWGGGLYTYTNGNYMYSADQGFHKFAAPGDAYVYRADFNLANWNYTPSQSMCTSAGIFTGTTAEGSFWANCSNYINATWGTCVSGTHPNCSTSAGTAGNDVESNFWAYGNGQRAAWSMANGTGAFSYTGIATVYVNDRGNPDVQWSGDAPPPTWTDGAGGYAVVGTDEGLGVKTVSLTAPASAPGWAGATANSGCNGTRFNRAANPNPCAGAKTLYVSLATLPEGPQTLHGTVTDAVYNASSLDSPVKIDRTAPSLSATGQLKNLAGQHANGSYDLQVTATDGSTSSGASQRSGVKSIEVQVDGVSKALQTQSCAPGSCSMTLTPAFKFQSADYGEGEHTIEVVATDQIDHTTTDSWDVIVDQPETDVIGPGSVDLITGGFSIDAMDAQEGPAGQGLGATRTYNSRGEGAVASGPFGPGWTASLPVLGQVGQYNGLIPATSDNPNVEVEKSDGTSLVFTPRSGGGFDSPAGHADLTLTALTNEYDLKDLDGNVFVFKPTAAGPWRVQSVQEPGSGSTTAFSYNGTAQVSYAVAPAPAGVTCSPASTALVTRGCRTLTVVYASATTATGNTTATWGDYLGQVTRINLTAWDPATSSMSTTAVAQYLYGIDARLRAVWDPRVSPALKTTYGYDAQGHLTSISPPGEAPWSLTYGSISGDPDTGRLKSVSRTGPNGPATTSVAYGVSLTGSGAPYQMGSSDVAAWGQTDVPARATAIFPPDQVPADPPTSWTRATVHYLDFAGRGVNTASPGGRISTTEYDSDNSVVRTLTAANRARVLAGTASASQVDTQNTYNADGTQLVDTVEPLHAVRLASGEQVSARTHTTTSYDQGAPSGGPYSLMTTSTVAAKIAGRPDADVRTTKTGYDGQGGLGWTLRNATSETTDAGTGGANLKTTTLYDAVSGNIVETRMPANQAGGDAHATKWLYYSAGVSSDPACANRPEWGNRLCKTQPAAQPNTPGVPNLPTTTYTYTRLNDVLTKADSVGAASRTTTYVYDAAGRETSHSITASDGTVVPPVTRTYDAATGSEATISSTYSDGVTRTISRAYDSLGRNTSYTDADGTVSTTTYDLLDRPVTSTDGKGSQTRTYDATTGQPTGLTDSAVGTFTATYDADANMLTQDLPNGLREQNTYDETGQLSHRSYVKVSNCSSGCTWLDFGTYRSTHGESLRTTGSLGTEDYTYDGSGRLTRTNDTPAGQGCTVRDYSLDADSNRTAQTSHAPGAGGACDAASAGTTTTHVYDAGDRLTDAGTTYDNFGRTLTLSAANAGGASIANSYYADDLTRSVSQGGVTNTYFRDPDARLRSIQTIGGSGQTTVLHYSAEGDDVSWQSEATDGSRWSRNVYGIDGHLVAVQDNVTGTKLQLENMHQDLVATASTSTTATGPAETFGADDFGNPRGGGARRYQWLGGRVRQTELASGVIEMGSRQYLPALGRFSQVDPIAGGSANAYDYVNVDPVNGVDLTGEHDMCIYYPHRGHTCVRNRHFSFFICDDKSDGYGIEGWVIQYDPTAAWFDVAPGHHGGPYGNGCTKRRNEAIRITQIRTCAKPKTGKHLCTRWYSS